MFLIISRTRESTRLIQVFTSKSRCGGADPDEVMIAKCMYQAMLDEYKEFSKKMKLPEQRERIYYDLRGRVAPSNSTKKIVEATTWTKRDYNENAEKIMKEAEKCDNCPYSDWD